MIDEKIIKKLKELGFKEYEAKVYAALAVLGPSKASEIAGESGVPRPRVYEVLKGLHEKGFVDITEGNPTYFKAVDPEKVIGMLRDKYIKAAGEAIINIKTRQKISKEKKWLPIIYLEGEWNIKNSLNDLVERSEKELIALTRGTLGIKLRKTFEKACEKGLRVEIILLKPSKHAIELLENYGSVYLIPINKIERTHTDNPMAGLAKTLISIASEHSVKGLFISDRKESILVYWDTLMKALLVKMPFIPILQRTALRYIIETIR
jgi:sugar-specific transcriptional regulator TrmB